MTAFEFAVSLIALTVAVIGVVLLRREARDLGKSPNHPAE